MLTHWSQFVPNNYVNPTSEEDIKLYVIMYTCIMDGASQNVSVTLRYGWYGRIRLFLLHRIVGGVQQTAPVTLHCMAQIRTYC